MKRVLCAFFLMSTTLIVDAALKEGDTAPDFTAAASLAGKATTLSLKDMLKKGPVVLYFYPSAYTNGCNLQAHSFAVNYAKFAAAGANIVGVSLDTITRLNEFSADPEFCAGKFPVVSDDEGKLSKAYDLVVHAATPGKKDTRGNAITHGFAERTTFIIASDGKIVASIGGLKGKENVEKSLAVVQLLKFN
ncbi:MAG: peroxiredoxin [Methylovulum sp.]